MMGAGKSTLGPVIAARLRRRFVDTDQEIERRAQASIPGIFEAEGESGFRIREAEVVASLEASGAVVALGGGALGQAELRERLLQSGIVVYLEASPESLVERVGEAENRPLLRGRSREERLDRIRELLSEREAAYQQAHITLNTEVWDVEALAARLEERLASVGAESEKRE
jgi:shikimate kinase